MVLAAVIRGASMAASALKVGGAVKKIAGKASKVSKVKKKTSVASKVLKVGGAVAAIGSAAYAVEQVAEKMGVRGGAGFIGKNPTKAAGGFKRYKKINPTNVKALKRSTKRLAAFDKIADNVRKELSRIAPRPKVRQSHGVITSSEALRALRQ